MDKAPHTPKDYQNNPFFVTTDGLELLFKKAQSVGITLAVIAGFSTILGLFAQIPAMMPTAPEPYTQTAPESDRNMDKDSKVTYQADSPFANSPSETSEMSGPNAGAIAAIFGGILLFLIPILLFFTFIGIIISGIINYTAARLAAGKEAAIMEALKATFANFWGFTWVLVLAQIKIFLWTLLFIIPGIIKSVQYSLAGVAFFDKGLRGNAAIKESMRLTKGAWLTTFASQSLLNLITLGAIPMLLQPAYGAILYRQFVAVGDSPKPKAHVLSWLTLIIPIVLTLLIVVGVGLLIYAFAQSGISDY